MHRGAASDGLEQPPHEILSAENQILRLTKKVSTKETRKQTSFPLNRDFTLYDANFFAINGNWKTGLAELTNSEVTSDGELCSRIVKSHILLNRIMLFF